MGSARRHWHTWPTAMLVIAAAAAASSCGEQREPVARLRVGTFWAGAAAKALRTELLAACQGLGVADVQVRLFGLASLQQRILAEESPGSAVELDLAMVPNDWLGVLSERALIGEPPPNHQEALRENVVTQALLAVSDNNGIIAYPIGAEALALVYNPRLLPREPRTLDDIFSVTLPAGVVPFSIDIANLYHLAPLLASYQGSLQRGDHLPPWDAAALRAVFRGLSPMWADPVSRSLATAADVPSLQVQLFIEQRLASFVAGPWLMTTLAAHSPYLAVAPIPPFRDSPHPARPLVGYQSLVVVRRSPWSDLAHTVAMRLLSPEAQRRLASHTARLPVLRRLLDDGLVLSNPVSLGFLRAVEAGEPMPSSSRWAQDFAHASERLQALFRARLQDSLSDLPISVLEETP